MAIQFNKENGAKFKAVEFPVSTKEVDPKTGEYVINPKTGKANKIEKNVQEDVPATLDDAILAEGKQKVFRRYIQALVIELQGEHRRDLQEKTPGERKRAPYLETLGI